MTEDKKNGREGNRGQEMNGGNISSGNSAAAQRARILKALLKGPLSTLEARRELDVLHPAARVMELKKMGFKITTYRRHEYTECGKLHRVGVYVLDRGGKSYVPPKI